ncbi:hypothetical protein K457DRAFT_138972 [Linnemannia elongata AG-77]|uniref:Uncharacterized protein n=1 Tax=Linnemannia elongata AG-77 TaxID=1314771 RepID=A0A197JUV7_9FUNG|nr:hypothetical protein K457DRAFT_138972 [Linnemannia elongata AG-77]
MLATHLKAKGASSSSTNDSTNTNTTNNHNHTSFAQGYSNPNSNNSNGDQETNPQSMSARLSAGMMPYFIPPPPPGASHPSRGAGGSGYSDDTSNNNNDSVLDLMTPPMSPTDHSFDFAATINSRFDAATTLSSSSSSTSTSAHHQYHHQHHQPSAFALDEPSYSPRTDRTNRTDKTDRTLLSALGTSSPASSGFSSVVSPRPVSFHWDDYQSLEEDQDDSSDQDDFDYKTRFRHHRPLRQEKYPQKYQNYESDEDDDDELEVRSTEADEDDEDRMRRAYQRQFEGHHSLVRRRSSFGGRGNGGGRGGDSYSDDSKYDSVRHGIGQNVSDVSEELAKARMAMNRASLAMRSMEAELKAMQLSIDESKASSASARSAIEENFWRLECLALTLEKDKQDMNKQLQAVGKDTHQAVETVTNWEVRIDWLERRVENTSEYVSELVLSEQECMSFIKMIIQQNQRYAMPAISKATERNIKLMAPPKQRVISPSPMRPMSPAPTHSIQPSPSPPPPPFASARVGHIPISWLLEPILPPRPPDLSSARVTELHESANSSDSSSNRNADPPAEFWRDFSRLTRAFETGQQRTPFSPFQRTRTRSASQGYGSSSANFQQGSSSSSINSSTSTSGVGSGGNSLFKQAMVRRPQVEALSPMPKILPPAVSATKMANPKRRSQNLAHLPVHSWLQFQFNKTMTTPGPLGKKKKTNVLGFQPITIFQTTTDGLPFVPRHGTSIKR